MRVPRKLKKKLKKSLPLGVRPTKENLLWIILEDYISVANSLIYLDNPDREALINWWNTNYSEDVRAKVICKQNFFKRLPQHHYNYFLHCFNTRQLMKY